jgi:type VI secretion system secreted protein VgrG
MVQYASNEFLYKLRLSQVQDDTVGVVWFEGEERLSGLYEYRIELVSDDPQIDSGPVLDDNATLIIQRPDEDPVRIHGIIARFEQRGSTPDHVSYSAILVPRLWRLGLSYGSRVFQNMTVEEIVTSVLEENGYTRNDFEFQLSNSYPQMAYCAQYRESDLNFVQRRLEHFGIFYYFDHRDDQEVVVFTDDTSGLRALPLPDGLSYNPNRDPLLDSETVSILRCTEKVVTGKVCLKDYNYEFPERNLLVEKQLDPNAPGVYYDFGDHFKNGQEGEFLARVRSEEVLCGSRVFSGTSDCRLLRAGCKFTLTGHYRDDWNAEYLVTRVCLRGSQANLFPYGVETPKRIPTFGASFDAIPSDRPFRPGRHSPIPRIPGIMTGRIESGSGDQYAFLDDQGRYRVKMPFDLSNKSNGQASHPIRMAQPYSGSGYGLHFPNHADTEIVWACVDGNVDRPLALSTVPNPSQNSPVTQQSRSRNTVRTAAGNEIVLEDMNGQTSISLKTADANTLVLDDKNNKIEMTSTNKNVLVLDDKNQNITVQTTNGHLVVVDDKNTKIVVQSKNGHRIVINDTSGSESITIADKKDENRFVMDITNKKLSMFTKNGSIDIQAPNGTIDIKATTLKVETKGDSTFKSANTKIEAKQDYSVKATNVKEEATMDYKEKGMNVKSEASMEHKTKGMNVTSEAGVNMQVKGTMVTVQSSGPNTIKGMPVLIN